MQRTTESIRIEIFFIFIIRIPFLSVRQHTIKVVAHKMLFHPSRKNARFTYLPIGPPSQYFLRISGHSPPSYIERLCGGCVAVFGHNFENFFRPEPPLPHLIHIEGLHSRCAGFSAIAVFASHYIYVLNRRFVTYFLKIFSAGLAALTITERELCVCKYTLLTIIQLCQYHPGPSVHFQPNHQIRQAFFVHYAVTRKPRALRVPIIYSQFPLFSPGQL